MGNKNRKLEQTLQWNDKKFIDEINKIKKERWVLGKDKKPVSTARITKAIRRSQKWSILSKDIINAEFID